MAACKSISYVNDNQNLKNAY